jgi:GMP synthase (glutamine-hydrolysing) A subunit
LSEERDQPSTDVQTDRGRTVHGEAANAGHRVLAPDDAEVEAYLEQALHAPPPLRVESEGAEQPDTVAVLDFGSQFAQLIARRVRELNVYSELLPHDTTMAELERRGVKAVILSGGPASVYDDGAPKADPALWSGRIPVLGICYGLQLMALDLGGEVVPSTKREYGPATVNLTETDGLFVGLSGEQPVWMSHGDSIVRPPEGFRATAQTDSTPYAGLADPAPTCTASSSTPRSSTRRSVAMCFATSSSASRGLGRTGPRPTSSRRPSPMSASGLGRAA